MSSEGIVRRVLYSQMKVIHLIATNTTAEKMSQHVNKKSTVNIKQMHVA